MAIYYDEVRKQFVLENEKSHYTFFVNGPTLRSGYWGEKLREVSDVPCPGKLAGEVVEGAGYVNHDQYNTEFVGWGGRFFNEPTIKVSFADGVRDLELCYQGYNINEKRDILTITLKDKVYDFEVELKYQVYEGLDIIDRSCILKNHTGKNVILNSVGSATVNFPYREEPYRLTALGSAWGQEYEVTRTPVTKSATVLQSRTGVSNVGNMPYFALDKGDAEENSGEVWFGALKWSGNHKIVVEVDPLRITRVTGGINDFDFTYVLRDGEEFKTPVFTFGYSKHGFSGGSRQLHEYIRQYTYKGCWADKCLPVLYNSWTPFEFDIDEKKLMALAEKAAKVGMELFVVDDGWFSNRDSDENGLGDWEPSPTKFPNGLDPLIKYVNDLGMMFGIWVEPEMVNPGSRLYKEHPDWILHFPGRDKELSRKQLVLNLAREDVYEFVIDFLDDLMDNHNIGYLKWDMNRWFSQPGWPEAGDEQQSMWVKYVWNLHRVFAHLHEKYPDVILENCASGGLRADLAMTEWCSRINRSDNQDPVDELYLHEGFTYINLPRSAGGAGHLSHNHTGINRRECSMEMKAHIGMMGSLGCSMNLNIMSEEELEELESYITLHKEIRHIVQLGDMYRLASIREKDYMAIEYVSKDKKEALVFLISPVRKFRLPYDNIKLYGLDPELNYKIDDKNTMSGDGLMKLGIPSACHTVGSMKSKLFRITAK